MYDLGKLEEKLGRPRVFEIEADLQEYLAQLQPEYKQQYATMQKNNETLKKNLGLVIDKVRDVMEQEK